MNRKGILAAVLLLLIAASTFAVDWQGMTGVGIRGPVFMPMFRGSEFVKFGKQYEPFMMGLDGALEVKYGLTNRLLLSTTAALFKTYDDTSATSSRSTSFQKKDNAYAKLTALSIGVTLQYYFRPGEKVQPYLLAGIGTDFWKISKYPADKSILDGRVQDFTAKYGLGVNFWLSEKFTLDLQVKMTNQIPKVSSNIQTGFYGANEWKHGATRPFNGYLEPSVGLTYFFGKKEADSDGDGVADSMDKCPNTPKGAKVDADGCPIDSDGDGVPDGIDQCPNTPRGAIVDKRGCPIDSDGDGVPDGIDKCPNTPAGVKVDATGCPPEEADADNDGVPDIRDKCPNTPAGVKVDANGCPLDSDGDGVPDYLDKCPDTPKGVKVDATGCPIVTKITEAITLHIVYANNSFEPDSTGKLQLDSVAEKMIAYPDEKFEIRGYTDNRGQAAYNLTLSQKRADGVKTYLISKGVAADRMTATGLGMDPKYYVADNATAAGRHQNRRVVIETIK